MIVAQPLAGDFTVLPNDLLRDTTLSFDARALMGWLLSLPRDWTIRLEQVRKHWNCNLARIKRVMGELIAAGWVQRRPSRRQADGTWSGGDYVVFNVRRPVQHALPIEAGDEPEVEAKETPKPESEIRTPVARVASPESAEPESGKRTPYEELSPPSNPPYPPDGGAPASDLESGRKPGASERRRPERAATRRPDPSQGCRGAAPPAVPPEAAAGFERLWAAYPESGRLPSRRPAHRVRALSVFAALTPVERAATIAAAGEEARIRGQHRTQARALHRWLEQGYWRSAAAPTAGAAAGPGTAPARVFVQDGSPGWEAWAAHHRRAGRPMYTPTRSTEHGADGWWFPAPFPPAVAEAA